MPPEERFDFERMELMNPNDPRAVGPPCHGEHEVAPPGRGSVTGANKHAMWEAYLHWRPRAEEEGSTAGRRRGQAVGGEEALSGQHGPAEQVWTQPRDLCKIAEGGLGRHAEEGPLRQENARGGRPRWWIPERPIGPRQGPINFDASQVGGNVEDHMMS